MISSISNARVKEVRKLQRRRNRYAARQVFIEGVRLVRDAWQAGSRPETVFYIPELMQANAEGEQLLTILQAGGVECVACTQEVFAAMAQTVTPQGIGAIVPLPILVTSDPPSLVLVLDSVREPGNAGTLLRTGEAAGVELVVFAPGTVDPFNDKALRAGMGAHFRLPIIVAGDWDSVRQRLSDLYVYIADSSAQVAYDQVDWRRPSALIIGGEASGASVAARQLAQSITIPMLGSAESLNAAAAGAVILFEAARQRRAV